MPEPLDTMRRTTMSHRRRHGKLAFSLSRFITIFTFKKMILQQTRPSGSVGEIRFLRRIPRNVSYTRLENSLSWKVMKTFPSHH